MALTISFGRSNHGRGGSGGAFTPAWRSGLAVNAWVELTGSNISAVDPSPTPSGNEGSEAKITSWTGFVADTRSNKVYSACNGGHAAYAGNEVDVIDLLADAPAWSEIEPPTANGDLIDCGNYYSDGKPSSRHTYYGVHLDTAGERIIILGGAHWCSAGGFTGDAAAFDLATNNYLADGTIPDVPSNLVSGVSAYCRDPSTGDIYGFRAANAHKWTRSTNTWSQIESGTGPNTEEAASAWDSTRGRIFLLGGSPSVVVTYVPGSGATTQSLTGAEAANVLGTKNGMVYVPSLDAYLLRKDASGGAVYKIDASTFECTALSTTGGSGIPAPTVAGRGPYTKWLYLPLLGGIFYCNTHTSNCWFLRVE